MGAFGFHLATMDVRQNSDVHERAVAELLKVAGAAATIWRWTKKGAPRCCWANWRMPGPLRSPYADYSAETARELAIADKAAALKNSFGEGAVAQYVISKAATPSDLLETAPADEGSRPVPARRKAAGARCASCRCSKPSRICARAPR